MTILNEIEDRAIKGTDAIGDMASGFRGPKMTIPVDENRDEDVIIMNVCHKDVPLLIRAVRQSQEMRLDVIHIRKWSKQEAGDLSASQILEAIQRMTTEALLKFGPDALALLEDQDNA